MEGNWPSSHAPFSPKLSNKNFEIAILFSIVDRSNNIVMQFAHCLRMVFIIGKDTDISQGGGEDFVLGMDFHRENRLRGGKFPGG